MIDWTTVSISIGGSLLGGVLSGTWQVNKSIKKQREERNKREIANWYHRVNSVCLRIHREVLRLPPNESIDISGYELKSDTDEVKLKRLNNLIDDLLKIHTEAPPEISRDLLNEIESLGFEYENIEPTMDEPTTTDIKDSVRENAEEIMDLSTKRSENYDEVPY